MPAQSSGSTVSDGSKDEFEAPTFPTATELVGVTLAQRWELLRLLHASPPPSGGNFGVGYVALDRQDGIECFVKIIDFRSNLGDIGQLALMLQVAKFEVDMHQYCVRMSKVVRMLGHGQLFFRKPDGTEYSFLYLVLELGEGDIKSHVDYLPERSCYWKLWVLRDVALAIRQIELGQLAHNDVKPSNVIRFGSAGSKHNNKLGDIGRAVTKAGGGPYDGLLWAGDPRHKPIETLYGWKESEWMNRHTAADAYMLGNMIAFLFVGASMTERIVSSLPPNLRPGTYAGSYCQVLDVIRHVWTTVVQDQVAPTFPAELRSELTQLLLQLTDPDPLVRGDPSARRAGVLGLDRIHSRLERMAQRALLEERVAAAAK